MNSTTASPGLSASDRAPVVKLLAPLGVLTATCVLAVTGLLFLSRADDTL